MDGSPIRIERIIRKMRGGSQAHTVKAADGYYYVAKFVGNPQGCRTLINDWIGHSLMRRIGISTPDMSILHLPALSSTIPGHENLYFLIGSHRLPPLGTVHLGSRYPVNPDKTAILDFIPPRLFPKVLNREDFVLALLCDKWLHNVDTRQCIFARKPGTNGLTAYFIDNGMIFSGDRWCLEDIPLHGVYFRKEIYVDPLSMVEEGLARIQALDEATLWNTIAGFPGEWLAEGDHEALDALLHQLQSRQKKLPDIISRHLRVLKMWSS